MFDGSIPCWRPRTPVNDTYTPRLRETAFGDGYVQRVLDGISNVDVTWSLVWDMRQASELIAMDDYLSNNQGNAFQFRHPMSGVMHDVICEEWSIEWIYRRKGGEGVPAIHYGTMSAEFIKYYGITG